MRALRVLQRRRESICAGAQADVARPLGGAITPAALAEAAVRAQARMDDAGARALADRDRAPACAAGCSHCCHVHADASIPEILAITEHLARAWTEEARATLRERLARQAARVERLTDEERWASRIPCALLDAGGRCTIHPARPLRCRAFHSTAVAPCRAAFEGDVDAAPLRIPRLDRAHEAVEEGYDRALTAAGVSPAGYRLELALRIALDEPGAGARWLAGDDGFARARSPSGSGV